MSSQFTPFSVGIAATNKKPSSDILYVLPTEKTPFVSGELDARVTDRESKGKDKNGGDYNVKVKENSTVQATWKRQGNGNRRTPPDVRRGERVMLYRQGNSGAYFWETMGMDDHLRKKETVVHSFSATDDESADSTSPDNSYSMEVNTHQGSMTLRTSKAAGEPFGYNVQVNAKEGAIVISDDAGNMIQLDSAGSKITLTNKQGSLFEVDGSNVKMKAVDSIAIKAGNKITLEAPNIELN